MKPDDAHSYHNLGLIHERRNNARQAAESFRRAVELDPALVEASLRLADLYRRQRNTELQEVALRNALQANPSSAALYNALGSFLQESARWEEAEQVYTEMLLNGVDATAALTGLGDVHGAQGNRDQAMEDYRQAIACATDPEADPEAIDALEQKLRTIERGP